MRSKDFKKHFVRKQAETNKEDSTVQTTLSNNQTTNNPHVSIFSFNDQQPVHEEQNTTNTGTTAVPNNTMNNCIYKANENEVYSYYYPNTNTCNTSFNTPNIYTGNNVSPNTYNIYKGDSNYKSSGFYRYTNDPYYQIADIGYDTFMTDGVSRLYTRLDDGIRLNTIIRKEEPEYSFDKMYDAYFNIPNMQAINELYNYGADMNLSFAKEECAMRSKKRRRVSRVENISDIYEIKKEERKLKRREMIMKEGKNNREANKKPERIDFLLNTSSEQDKNTQSLHTCVHTESECRLLAGRAKRNEIKFVYRRLDAAEKGAIKAGSVFIYTEKTSKIRRWTDGRNWAPSRVNGCFLTYSEASGVLFKKTWSIHTEGDTIHIVAYSTNEWERTKKCCVKYEKTKLKEPLMKTGGNKQISKQEEFDGMYKELKAGY